MTVRTARRIGKTLTVTASVVVLAFFAAGFTYLDTPDFHNRGGTAMTTANINERGTCRSECDVTWHQDYGHNSEEAGTHGAAGDVRRCEHGHVWIWTEQFENRYFCSMDRWRRLHPWWNWRQYRRAVAALADSTSTQEVTP